MDKVALVLLGALVGGSCGPAQSGEPISATASPPSATSTIGATAAAPAPSAPGTAAASPAAPKPAFLLTQLTDVRSGERFTLGQFEGKVVIVQGMAVW